VPPLEVADGFHGSVLHFRAHLIGGTGIMQFVTNKVDSVALFAFNLEKYPCPRPSL
jgi:hypothetical protein